MALILAAALALLTLEATGTPSDSAQLRARAYDAVYNLDYPEGVRLLDEAIARDPNNSANERARAAALWLHIVFERGSVTVDQYLGRFSRRDVAMDKPPAGEDEEFKRHAARALALAEQDLAAHPASVQALYDVGAAVGVMASYDASVDGRISAAFRDAKRAFDAHERVLALDPSRKDAGLVVGTYRYVVSTLSLPVRWIAYLAGFGGDGALGLRMIEDAAKYKSDVQSDAKVALLLLYNRERRYDDALAVARDLMRQYPRNRLFRLEAGATEIRARHFANADRLLSEGIAALAGDPRPRAFGEEAIWFYKRALARVELRNLSGASSDLERAGSLPAKTWVKARIALERGRLADLAGQRDKAVQDYREAAHLADIGHDDETASAAQGFVKSPYR